MNWRRRYLNCGCTSLALSEFQTITPGIVSKKAPSLSQSCIPSALNAAFFQSCEHLVDVRDLESGMRFGCGPELFFDTNVELPGPDFEPAPATRTQRLGLLQLFELQQAPKEIARCGFAPRRRRNLHMIEIVDQHYIH